MINDRNLIIEAVMNTHVYSYPEGERPPKEFLDCCENKIFKKTLQFVAIVQDSKLDLTLQESVAMLEVILARLEIEYKRFLELNQESKEYDYLKKYFQASMHDILSEKSHGEKND